MVRPRALAVLRLRANSNLVGCPGLDGLCALQDPVDVRSRRLSRTSRYRVGVRSRSSIKLMNYMNGQDGCHVPGSLTDRSRLLGPKLIPSRPCYIFAPRPAGREIESRARTHREKAEARGMTLTVGGFQYAKPPRDCRLVLSVRCRRRSGRLAPLRARTHRQPSSSARQSSSAPTWISPRHMAWGVLSGRRRLECSKGR